VSDARLRELERRWKSSGTVEDEAAYLLERVRVGNLTENNLHLAAHCFHPAAMTANTESTCCIEARRSAFWAIRALAPLSPEAIERFCISFAWIALRSCKGMQQTMRQRTQQLLVMLIQKVTSGQERFIGTTLNDHALDLHNLIEQQSFASDNLFAARMTYLAADAISREQPGARTATAQTMFEAACNASEVPWHSPLSWPSETFTDLSTWALGNDPLPALLARLEAEAGA
jgi:hypothetical protein